jgi:hypothetical protein
MNKNDSLKKHHFWILAGLAPLLALLSMIFLMTGPGEAKDKAAADIAKNLDQANKTHGAGYKVLKEDYPKQKEVLLKQREKLWKANYEDQKRLFDWPQSPRLQSLEQRYQKFGEKMNTPSLEFDDLKKSEVYEAAYDRAGEAIKPTTFPGGTWRRVLRYVSNWGEIYPTSDRVWLALEDLWVQKALLVPVNDVNAEASKFVLVQQAGPDGKPVEPPPLERTFRSRIWELKLKVPTTGPNANKVILAELKNLTNRLQVLGNNNEMRLNVWLSEGAQPIRYRIQKDFVKANEEIKVDTPVPLLHSIPGGTEVQKIVKVEQVLDERTAPVRQVLNIELGYKDARHYPAQLKKPKWWPDTPEATTQPGGGPFGGAPGGPPAGAPGGPSGAPGLGSPEGGETGGGGFKFFGGGMIGGAGATGGRGAKAGSPASVLDYNKDRYVEVTDQVRRMPVALVLLVDQMFVQDALVAYANSPLRFQITQYHWKRFRGSLSGGGFGGGFPFAPGGGETGGGEPGGGESSTGSPESGGEEPSGYSLPGAGGGPGGLFSGMPGGPGGYGSYSGFGGLGGFGAAGSGGGVSEAQITSGLVELTIYGIVTLYEKYEEKAADGTAAGTTTSTGAATEATGTTTPAAGTNAGAATAPAGGTTNTNPPTDPKNPAPAAPPNPTPPGGTTPPGAAPPAPPK